MSRKLTLVFLFVVCTALQAFAHGPMKYVNGKWFDGTNFVDKTVYTVDGRFADTFDGELQETVDLKGAWVIPPFADAHNHGLGNPATLDREVTAFLRAGIFYVKNPNNIASFSVELRSRLGGPTHPDVVYANGGLTATGGHPIQIYDMIAKKGVLPGFTPEKMAGEAYFVVDTPEDLAAKWPAIVRWKPDFIKLYLEHSEEFARRREDPAYFGKRGLDPALLPAIVAHAHREGLTTTVHVTTAADFHNALVAGTDEIAHLPLAPLDPEDAKLAAKQHTTVVTTILSHRPTEGIADVVGLQRRNLTILHDAGVNVVIGTDGDKTAVDEALVVASLNVYTPLQWLRLWTEATADEILPGRKVGRLQPGYEASFLTLDRNPLEDPSAVRRIGMRVKQGHVIALPPELPGVADVLAPIAKSKGGAAALEEYDRLLATAPNRYDYSEAQLNRLGYDLLHDHKVDDAIRLFERNAARFPHSANVWDSLAEGCLLAGRRDDAIANYRKSLALDPKNANATRMLEQLQK